MHITDILIAFGALIGGLSGVAALLQYIFVTKDKEVDLKGQLYMTEKDHRSEYRRSLEGRVESLEERIVELNRKVETWQSQYFDIKIQNNQLVDQNARLIEENKLLREENEKLENRIAKLEESYQNG